MHIAMLAQYPAPGAAAVGGVQVAAARLVPALARRGIQVTVVAPAAEQRNVLRGVELDDGLELVQVPAGEKWSLLTGLRTFRRHVHSVVTERDFDLVHAQ